ncbi:MAG: PEGA domain-containing protein [Bacteroidales bacterium]|nr:PEGA domain-containing protein [Bacteroidales bacterium]
MKRLSLIIFTLISLNAFSQLQVKEGSFKYVPNAVMNDKYDHLDGNDMPMALIKISTENIPEQERLRLKFQGNLATQITKTPKTGQMWIYISAENATFINIMHPDYGTCKYYIPEKLCDFCTYEMVLQYVPIVNEAAQQQTAYFIIKSNQDEVDIYIDGEYYGQTPNIIPGIMPGEHQLRLTKIGCYDIEKTITVVEGKTLNVNEKMVAMSRKDLRASMPKNEKNDKTYLTADMAYSVAPEMSYGLTVGQLRKVGWYVTAMSNFKFDAINCELECDKDGRIDGDMAFYDGETTSSRISVGAGALLRVAEPLYLKAGVGYGLRDIAWHEIGSRWIKNSYYSYRGMELDAGVLLSFGMLNVSCDAVLNMGHNVEFKLGLGISF